MRDHLDYRPDLDGLRAVAVVPVILFHLGVQYTPGGFVGVDVFFVLSGYLITRQVALDLSAGNFSILGFYDRRIRRLFPALFAMLFATTALAILVLLPHDLMAFGRSLSAAAFSAANVHFWIESDYFAPSAETMPLLHTWSLAVEEQYYLLFPPLVMIVWRFGGTYATLCVCILALVSFAVSIWASTAAPDAAFFLLPSRAWELLLGSILALAPRSAWRPAWLRNAASLLGLAAIAIAVYTYSADTTFPGLAAAVPCLGAAFVIWAGEPTSETSPDRPQARPLALRFLALPPFVFVGLISYSLYLWHWPLIAFTRYLSPGPLNLSQQMMVAVATFAIACASWKLIEQPFRRGGRIWTTRTARLRAGGALVGGFAVLGLTLVLGKGHPWLQSRAVQAVLEDASDRSPLRGRCHIGEPQQGKRMLADTCSFGGTDQRPVIVLGDSHGAELSYALSKVARERGLFVRQVTASACPAALGYAPNRRRYCARHMEMMMKGLAEAPPSTVLIAAFYFEWARRGAPQSDDLWNGVDRAVARLRQSGHKVVLLGDWPPHGQGHLPRFLALEIKAGRSTQGYSFAFNESLADEIDARLGAIAGRHAAIYVPLLEKVCQGRGQCQAYAEGRAIYFDDDHLTVTSALRIVKDLILPLLEQGESTAATGQLRPSK